MAVSRQVAAGYVALVPFDADKTASLKAFVA
jgi:hypothetical protein